MMFSKKEFGARLKQRRLEKGLTQTELAQKVGTSLSMISTYELGIYTPGTENLFAMAAVLNCTTDWLLGIEVDAIHSKRRWLIDMGKILRTRRWELGLTMWQVAEQIGIPEGTYNNYELGKCNPPMDKLARIAQVLKTTPQSLLDTKPPAEPKPEPKPEPIKTKPPMDDLFTIKKPLIEPVKSYELEFVFELDNTTYNLTRSELQ